MRLAEPPLLRQLQACVLRSLREESFDARLEHLLASPAGDTVGARWHVYASGYHARLVEALENDFPALRRILGAGPFASLTARYARALPPRSFDLGRFGDRLAGFLHADPLAAELPFLSDLARLEWALAEAFVARGEAALDLATVQAAGAERVAEWRLGLVAGAQVIESAWPLVELWATQAQEDREVDVDLRQGPAWVLARRRGERSEPLSLGTADAALLRAIAGGARLGDLAAEATEPEQVDDLALRFRAWIEAGVIVRRPEPEAAGAAKFATKRSGEEQEERR